MITTKKTSKGRKNMKLLTKNTYNILIITTLLIITGCVEEPEYFYEYYNPDNSYEPSDSTSSIDSDFSYEPSDSTSSINPHGSSSPYSDSYGSSDLYTKEETKDSTYIDNIAEIRDISYFITDTKIYVTDIFITLNMFGSDFKCAQKTQDRIADSLSRIHQQLEELEQGFNDFIVNNSPTSFLSNAQTAKGVIEEAKIKLNINVYRCIQENVPQKDYSLASSSMFPLKRLV